jgi:hypothetical protein
VGYCQQKLFLISPGSVLFAVTMTSLSITVADDMLSSAIQSTIKFLCNQGEKVTSTVTFSYSSRKSACRILLCSSGVNCSKMANIPYAICSTMKVAQRPVCVDFLLERKAMNAAYYCYLLKHKLKPAIRTKSVYKCPKESLLSMIMPVHILHR